MDLQLTSKTALVTRASAGIGRGIEHALVAEGVQLAIPARRVELLNRFADEIVETGGARPVVIESDLIAKRATEKLAQAALTGLGSVDILVNNDGGSRSIANPHCDEAYWEGALELCFSSAAPDRRRVDRSNVREEMGPHHKNSR